MDGRSAQQSRSYKEPEETDCEAGPEGFNCCQHRGFSHPKKVQQQIRSADDSPLHTIPKKRLSKKYRSLSKKCKPIIQILNANCRSVSVVAQPPMTRPPTEAAKKKSRIVFGAPGGPVKPRRIVQFKLQAGEPKQHCRMYVGTQ